MGHALIRLALMLSMLALAAPSLAQTQKPDTRDAATIVQCLKAAAAKAGKQENCIGIVSTPCLQDDKANGTTVDMDACGDREFFVWNDLLQRTVLRLRKDLDSEQRVKLDAMQDAWETSLGRSFSFYRDYFRGTMAGPLISQCMADETGRRVLFLLGFVDDAGLLDGKDGK
jgi:uncharacterized protein YecT (DUF1311 family)